MNQFVLIYLVNEAPEVPDVPSVVVVTTEEIREDKSSSSSSSSDEEGAKEEKTKKKKKLSLKRRKLNYDLIMTSINDVIIALL